MLPKQCVQCNGIGVIERKSNVLILYFCSILSNLRELSENCLGRPMLYELIEVNYNEK